MSDHYHAVVWIDHHRARVIHFNPKEEDIEIIYPHHEKKNLRSHAFPRGSNHAAEDQDYLKEVVEAISSAKSVLIMGPSNEKNELVKYIEKNNQNVNKIIAGVETCDHPSDKEILAHARKFFKAYDHMTPL